MYLLIPLDLHKLIWITSVLETISINFLQSLSARSNREIQENQSQEIEVLMSPLGVKHHALHLNQYTDGAETQNSSQSASPMHQSLYLELALKANESPTKRV